MKILRILYKNLAPEVGFLVNLEMSSLLAWQGVRDNPWRIAAYHEVRLRLGQIAKLIVKQIIKEIFQLLI